MELLNVEGSAAEIGIKPVELEGALLQASPSLSAVSANRYWEVDVVSGFLNNSKVILPVRDEQIANIVNQVVVAQAETVTGLFENIGQSKFEGSVGNGKVTSDQPLKMPFLAVGTASEGGAIVVYQTG